MTNLEEIYITITETLDPTLIDTISKQSAFTVNQIIEEDPSVNRNETADFCALFCLGAVWAIREIINECSCNRHKTISEA